MSMIHTLRQSLIKRLQNTSDDTRLALKMSIISFVVLIVILTLIIGMSYIWQQERLYREFREEIRMFSDNPIGRALWSGLIQDVRDIPVVISDRMRDGGWRGPRGMRDVIIFSREKKIIQNDFIDIESDDIDELYQIGWEGEWILENDGHHYLTYRRDFLGGTVFFMRDIEQLRDFHEWLIIIALSGSVLGLFIIYWLSRHLARLVIEPIREHNRALTAYSHNVAHELKTPLAVMRSNMELLRLAPWDKLISSTEEEVVSMEHIIDTLLLLANPNKHREKKENLELTTTTKKLLENYSEADIDYTHPEKDIHLECAPELYKRILSNLVENALKYRSTGTVIVELESHRLTIKNTIQRDLNPEELEKLTEAFYQADTSRASSGQWLGLALVQKIVDVSGWRLRLTSQQKTFTAEIIF